MRAAKASIKISGFQVYSDGSGAPALVQIADYGFACDWINGAVSMTCVKPAHGSRRESEVAARRARDAYVANVQANTTEDWRALNLAMYADLVL